MPVRASKSSSQLQTPALESRVGGFEQADNVFARDRPINHLRPFDFVQHRCGNLINFVVRHASVFKATGYVELGDKSGHPICAFQSARARIAQSKRTPKPSAIGPKRSGAIPAMNRITCGMVMHDVTPCATSHLGPI